MAYLLYIVSTKQVYLLKKYVSGFVSKRVSVGNKVAIKYTYPVWKNLQRTLAQNVVLRVQE